MPPSSSTSSLSISAPGQFASMAFTTAAGSRLRFGSAFACADAHAGTNATSKARAVEYRRSGPLVSWFHVLSSIIPRSAGVVLYGVSSSDPGLTGRPATAR